MRRKPFSFGAVFVLAVFWLAARAPARVVRSDVGGTAGAVHGEIVAISSSHVAVGSVSAPRKASPSEWSSRLFLPSRRVAFRDAGAAAPLASASSRIREREQLTFTYDATAPPGKIQNTVR
jgi:hypothetical protein